MLIVILLTFSIYFIAINRIHQENYRKIVENTKNSLNLEINRSLTRDRFLNLLLKFNDSKMNNELMLTDEKGKTCKLTEKLNRKKLIFRYSELQCNVCIEQQIASLKKYKNKIGTDNILILADYSNFRNLIVFKRINSLDIPIYNLSKKMPLERERINIPYFFIADNTLIAKDYFIPIKEIKNYTDNYLNTMYIKHFSIK